MAAINGIDVTAISRDHFHLPVLDFVHHDFTTLPENATVAEALARLRKTGVAEKIVYFYVLDELGRLAGVMPTRRLLMADLTHCIRDLMVRRVITLPETATVLDACEFFLLYKFLAFPVLHSDRTIAGVVDVGLFTEEMADVAERQAADDLFQLIGVHVAQARSRSLWESFRTRFPWLLANILGGMLCAIMIEHYESFLGTAIVLALFIPVVLALAESVSIQSMTITLQGIHDERLDRRSLFTALRREIVSALALGASCGGVVAIIIALWKKSWVVAGAVGLSILVSMLTACLLGVALPAAVRALRGDPRIASGPIVLATADLAALLFYFNLAGWLLK